MKFIQKFGPFVILCFYSYHSVICDSPIKFATGLINRFRCRVSACDKISVEVKQGFLRGREFQSVLAKEPYYGFLGIPYAKPPLGELRFQPPQPLDPWEGVYDATYERKWCFQKDPFIHRFEIGSEDCLHLNVFTPEIPTKINQSKAVMVFIHGGGFARLSGTKKIFSADYLMKRDIILVTMNYRLLALGFFNLGIPESPGNAGLKDQLIALKWINENIAQFGGDPEQITIFGESAGASSVYYHLISPLSIGLFTKAIMESGTALSPWAITYNPIEQAFEIGKRCGYHGNDTKELLSYMKTLSAEDIVSASNKYIKDFREIYPGRTINISPSVEEPGVEAFLPDWPINLAKTATPIPTIFGVNDKEGLLIYLDMSSEFVQKVSKDFSIILKDNFKLPRGELKELTSKTKRLYFGDTEVGCDTIYELVDLYSDIFFYYGYQALEFLTNSTTPPHIYVFAYEGRFNLISRTINLVKRTEFKGASHADELFYLFYPEIVPFPSKLDQHTINVIDNMTLMWSNFAKTGNPSGDVEWKPSTVNEPRYLQIKETQEMVSGTYYGDRLKSLKNLLDPDMEPGAKPYDIF